jgi:hypothetical protein
MVHGACMLYRCRQVATKAEPLGDGRFKINGTKIFISCGEHDMTNNIIHCVLARLPGAPEGTKGISLFLVPKHKVDEEGNISEAFNGVNIGRIEVGGGGESYKRYCLCTYVCLFTKLPCLPLSLSTYSEFLKRVYACICLYMFVA